MPAAPGDGSSESLAAAFADPAVLVDGGGLVAAWNAAAAARFGIPADTVAGTALEALVGDAACTARRLALADAGGGQLLVWPRAGEELGADDIALEKLAIIERISSPVSHEIKGAIGPQSGFAELALGEPDLPDYLRELGTNAVLSGAMATSLTTAMFEFSRARSMLPVNLADIARGTLALLKAPALNMESQVTIPDTLPPVQADGSTVRHALLAVVVNALEAQGSPWVPNGSGPPGRLRISARQVDDADGRWVRIAVEDGAPKVPEAERGRLFSGHGAGRASADLAVARALVERAGGRISYEPVLGGNRIAIELPAVGSVPRPNPELPPLVLVCDPEPLIRTLLVRFLTRVGARAVEARDADEAMQLLAREPVELVVADLGLDAHGAGLYDGAVAARPDLASRFVLVTADPAGSAATLFASRTGVPVLPKPFDNVRLEQVVRARLGL